MKIKMENFFPGLKTIPPDLSSVPQHPPTLWFRTTQFSENLGLKWKTMLSGLSPLKILITNPPESGATPRSLIVFPCLKFSNYNQQKQHEIITQRSKCGDFCLHEKGEGLSQNN